MNTTTDRSTVQLSGMALATILVGTLLGFVLGRATADDAASGVSDSVRTGVVGAVDDDGTVCIDGDDCYLVPGAHLKVGTKIHYRVEKQFIDPGDPDRGKQSVLVYVK